MRDSIYIDSYIKRLKKLWKNYPNIALGTLIASAMNYQQIYYYSDEELLRVLEQHYPIIASQTPVKNKKGNSGGDSK